MTTTQTATTKNEGLKPLLGPGHVPLSTGNADLDAKIARVSAPHTNPGDFKDPLDIEAATVAKMHRILDNPKFQKLATEKQNELKGKFYDEYVGKQSGIDRDLWIKEIGRQLPSGEYQYGVRSYYDSTNRHISNFGGAAEQEALDTFSGLVHFGVKLGQEASMEQLKLNNFFEHGSFQPNTKDVEHLKSQAQKITKPVDDVVGSLRAPADFWFQTHPSHGWKDGVDTIAGRGLVQLPFYSAIGAARDVVGMKNLSLALGKSATGKIVATALENAVDGFLGDIVTNKDAKEASKDAAYFAGFGAASEGFVRAAKPVIKKFLSQVAAMGGKPLVQAAFNEATHELETAKIGGEAPPANHTPTPETAVAALNKAHAKDPAKTKLVTGTKAMVQALSQSNFKKDFKDLTAEQKTQIRTLHKQLTQKAIDETPIHNPTQQKQNTQKQVKEELKTNPALAQTINKFEQKFGVSYVDAVNGGEVKKIKEQTNTQKIDKDIKRAVRAKTTEAIAKAHPEAVETEKQIEKTIAPLPANIRGSKPRYGKHELSFADPRDLAAYTLGQSKDNKAQKEFEAYAIKHFGSLQAALERRNIIKDYIKKEANSISDDELIKVPLDFSSESKPEPPPEDPRSKPGYGFRR